VRDVFPWPDGQLQALVQVEERDCPVFELSSDDSLGRQPQPVAIEREGSFQVVHADGQQRCPRFHWGKGSHAAGCRQTSRRASSQRERLTFVTSTRMTKNRRRVAWQKYHPITPVRRNIHLSTETSITTTTTAQTPGASRHGTEKMELAVSPVARSASSSAERLAPFDRTRSRSPELRGLPRRVSSGRRMVSAHARQWRRRPLHYYRSTSGGGRMHE